MPPDPDTWQPPRITVVVPTCRRPELLARCMKALLAQSVGLQAFEIVVVDDAHSDATREWVKATACGLPRDFLRYVRPIHRRGPAAARNAGWQEATARLIAFTDDDTVPAIDWLEEGEKFFRSEYHVAVAGRVIVPRDGPSPPTDHAQMTRGLEHAEFVTANAFVLRVALERVRGFDERFKRAWREDSDLQFRLEDLSGPVGRCPAAVVYHPVRPERWGVSLRQQKNVFFDALLFRKHPGKYRSRVRRRLPWDYYGVVILTVAAVALAITGAGRAAAVCGLLVLALVLRFALRRLKGTTRAPAHVAEMLLTSALIPYLSVYWRLRGAWHFRVWFL